MSGRPKQGDAERLFSVVAVDSRHRLFLPKRITEIVEWLDGGGIDCTSYLSGGGVRLVPRQLDDLRGRLDAMLGERRLTQEDAATGLGDLVRFAATSWSVHVDEQLRLTLPEDARKLGVLPEAGQRAAVFASGDIVEIWPAEEWRQTMRRLSKELPRLIDEEPRPRG